MDLIANYGGELAALAGALFWAVASVIYGRAGRQIPPRELNLVKGLLALAMLGLTLLALGESLAAVEPLALALLLLSGALGIGLGDTAYFVSLNELGARRALLVGILAPPVAALLAWALLGETLTAGAWLGVLVTVAGVAWVVTERAPDAGGTPDQAAVQTPPPPPGALGPPRAPAATRAPARGVAFGLLAVLAQSGGVVLSRAAFIQTDVSPLGAAFLRLAAGVGILPVWILLARRPAGRWLKAEGARQLWLWLVFAITIGTYLAIWLQQVALKLTSAGIMQTLFSTSPLFVLPLAAALGERVSPRAVLGASVALAGIGLLFGLQ